MGDDKTDGMAIEIARLRAENEALKSRGTKSITYKVSDKGGLSVYGLGRFPVTLYQEQWNALQVSLDLVSGITSTFSMNEPSNWLTFDHASLAFDPNLPWRSVIGGISMGTVNLESSPYLTVIQPPNGGEFSLTDCHIEVGDMGGGIHVVGDPDQVKTTISGNYIEQIPGFKGMRISPYVPEVHPERKRVLDLLATLPEDMPIMVLTPQSVSEVETAKDHRARMRPGSVQQRGVESLTARLSDYQGSRGKYPLDRADEIRAFITENVASLKKKA